jgi:pyrroloquinoline quinone biosynthesis protein D
MTTLRPEQIPSHATDAEAAQVGDELVLLDPAGSTLRGLNETGARVWELVDGTRAIRAIAETIAAEYSAPVDEVLADVMTFLSQLADRALVTIRDPDPARGGAP